MKLPALATIVVASVPSVMSGAPFTEVAPNEVGLKRSELPEVSEQRHEVEQARQALEDQQRREQEMEASKAARLDDLFERTHLGCLVFRRVRIALANLSAELCRRQSIRALLCGVLFERA